MSDSTAAAPDAPRPTPKRSMTLWMRALVAIAFEVVVLVGIWWALHPDDSSSGANPGTFPTLLAWVALILFVVLMAQASCRIPLWVWALLALLCLPALAVGTRAVDGLTTMAATRVDDARATTSTRLSNGMWRSDVTLPDGSSRTVYSVSRGDASSMFSGQNSTVGRSMLQTARRPFQEPTTKPATVLVDGLGYDRFWYGTGRSVGHTVDMIWLLGAVILWIPLQIGVASSLFRKRGWWSRLGDDDVVADES